MSFAPFLDNAAFTSEGQVSFEVEAAAFKEAVTSVRLPIKDATAGVRCAVFPSRAKLSSYALGMFAEDILDLAAVSDAPEEGVAFVADVATLGRIVGSFPHGRLRITHDAQRRLLTASAGPARIEFATQPMTKHTDYTAKLGFPSLVGPVPVDLLRQGLRYASLFTPPGREAVAHVVAKDMRYAVRLKDGSPGEVHQGMVAGGSGKAVLAFQSQSLRGLDLSLHQGVVDFAIKALGRLDPSHSLLYQTSTFGILLDHRRMFGMERSVLSYPTKQIEHHLTRRPDDLVQAQRKALRQALQRVATVSDQNQIVQLSVAGTGSEARLTVRMTDPSGRMAEDSLDVLRGQGLTTAVGKPRDALINLRLLSTLLGHFAANETVSFGFDGLVIRLFDRVPDASATSVLVCESPPVVKDMQENLQSS